MRDALQISTTLTISACLTESFSIKLAVSFAYGTFTLYAAIIIVHLTGANLRWS